MIETQANDVTTYIPTNVISITDGQIYLESDLFHAGIRPAINVGISASRVGGKAQTSAMKKIAGSLRLDLAQYRELAAFTQFGSELDDNTRQQLTRGEVMIEVLKQDKFDPYPLEKEVAIIFVGNNGYLDGIPIHLIKIFEKEFLEFLEKDYKEVLKSIAESKKLEDKNIETLKRAVELFIKTFSVQHKL